MQIRQTPEKIEITARNAKYIKLKITPKCIDVSITQKDKKHVMKITIPETVWSESPYTPRISSMHTLKPKTSTK